MRPAGALVASVVVAVAVAAAAAFAQQGATQSYRDSPFLRVDPDKVLITDGTGQKPCGECHKSEVELWRTTKHAMQFDSLHRSDRGKEIMQDMGLRVTKRQDAICMRCHYTVGPDRVAVAGVSCESCHGPARDWINVHNKFANGARDRTQETPAAREQRVAASRAGGMLRPSTDIYAVAANCFECHTVPMEPLVNRGKHSTGSKSFDLVAAVNKIRHNFLNPGGQVVNRPMTREQTRVMFVMGRVLGYEYALRGVATATTDGRYLSGMVQRVSTASDKLDDVTEAMRVSAVDSVLAIGRTVKLKANNRAELERAADQIRAVGQRFASGVNGATLTGLDPLVFGEAAPEAAAAAKSEPAAAPARTPAPSAGRGAATPSVAPSPKSVAVSPGATPSTPAVAPTPAAAAPAHADLPGKVRNRPEWLNANFRKGFAESGKCASCHTKDAGPWFDSDRHSNAAKKFKGENPKAIQIAELYGIGEAGMRRPENICMGCHAGVDDANPRVAVEKSGLACESCHGAGASWLDSHKNGNNPQSGMRDLKKPLERAQTCAGCHRMTDERLLAAGHTSGANYDFVAANEKIKHWPDSKPETFRRDHSLPAYAAPTADALRAAWTQVVNGRAMPKVTVVATTAPVAPAAPTAPAAAPVETKTAAAPSQPGNAPATVASPAETAAPESAPAARRRPIPVPSVRSALPPAARSSSVTLHLDPVPPTDSLTAEDLLLLLKKRIEQIHAAIARPH